ncbi:MAG: hypothetical protein LC658_12000, partial [Bacteroidales bacterium]|nr:hypothetical protein [Bacteroidales bacterium]
MRVIFSACWIDPWGLVAEKLKALYNMEPVCWIGYENDKSEYVISEKFPECFFVRYYDAWKGIFPLKLRPYLKKSNVDIDFMRENASYELQALKMMDRMDPERHSFSFMERQRHYRELLNNWQSVLDYLKPDAIVSATVPHRVYDYVIYLLCQKNGIPFISLRETAFIGRIIPIRNISQIKSKIEDDYKEIWQKGYEKSKFLESLPSDILDRYKKVNLDYKTAEPLYMKRHVDINQKESSLFGNYQKFVSKIKANKERLLGKNGYLYTGFPSYHKRKNRSIENSTYSFLEHAKRKWKANNYKYRLKKYYDSLVNLPDFTQPYVFFAMHYQPEMTSNPAGDIFADQKLCLDVLVRNLPSDYWIYVKEHPSQFYSHTEGHSSRIKSFYDDLLKYPNVKLIPVETNTFDLIENARAVSTVTGTAGWEGMVRKKPVIIFGFAWYEAFDGVLKIKNQTTAEYITAFIENYHFDELDLLAYLQAFSENSFRA